MKAENERADEEGHGAPEAGLHTWSDLRRLGIESTSAEVTNTTTASGTTITRMVRNWRLM